MHRSRVALRCRAPLLVVLLAITPGCYESHYRLPIPCGPELETLVVEDDSCIEMTMDATPTGALCPAISDSDFPARGARFRVVNLSLDEVVVRLSLAADTTSPVHYGEYDSTTCACFSGTRTFMRPIDSCFAAFRLPGGETREMTVATDGVGVRVRACREPPGPPMICNGTR